MSLHYNADKSYLFVNGKEINEFKAYVKTVKCRTESREIYLSGNVCDFLVDYNSTDKSNILNVHKYLMIKNNIN